jgi:cytochrome c553
MSPEFLRARALYWVGDASAGIASRAACHDGAEAAPSLQSQHAGYLAKELDDLRSGARANDDGVMRAIASKLSDADIEALSDYLASQPSTNVRR